VAHSSLTTTTRPLGNCGAVVLMPERYTLECGGV